MATVDMYTTGGTIQIGRGIYIERQADAELLTLCRNASFAYILTARQMGKSSLIVRIAQQLETEGIRTVCIDLTLLGTNPSAEQWYLGLLVAIEGKLTLGTDVTEWWDAHSHLGFTQRLTCFFIEIVLAEVAAPVVLFVDEIDTTLSLHYTDDFFAAIRGLYNARATIPDLCRISFVLVGVASPNDLIRDPQRTPFNIGRRIDLMDFTVDEAAPFIQGLGMPRDQAEQVLHQVLYWTEGHPYLTQRLCAAIATRSPGSVAGTGNRTSDTPSVRDLPQQSLATDGWSASAVAQVVRLTFFDPLDNNLLFVTDMLTRRAPDALGVMRTYRDVHRGDRITDEERSVPKAHLKLSGVVRDAQGVLRVRNRIYEQAFDEQWIHDHWPRNWWEGLPRGIKVAAILIVFLLVVLSIVTTELFVARSEAQTQAQLAQTAQAVAQQEVHKGAAILVRSVSDYQFDLALLLGVEATRVNSSSVEVRGTLFDLLEANPNLVTFLRGSHNDLSAVVAFSRDGTLLASGGNDHTVRLWDIARRRPLEPLLTGYDAPVESLLFRPDGRTLIASDSLGMIKIWDIATRQQLRTIKVGNGGWGGFVYNRNGTVAAYSDSNGGITLWDATTGRQIGDPITDHTNWVVSVAFSPDGMRLASGSDDQTVRLWDVATHKQIGLLLKGHATWVRWVIFSPDGTTLISNSADGVIRLWDVATRKPIGPPIRSQVGAAGNVRLSADGRALIAVGRETVVEQWEISLDSWQARACEIAARNLTRAEWEQYFPGQEYHKTCPAFPDPPDAGQ